MALAAADDGDLLAVERTGEVRAVVLPGTARAAAAVTGTELDASQLRVTFRTTLVGQARVDLLRGGAVVDTASAPVNGGYGGVVLRRPGAGLVGVRLTVAGRDGATAVSELGLSPDRLTKPAARFGLRSFFAGTGRARPELGRCKALGPRRVDCVEQVDGNRCARVFAVAVGARTARSTFRVYRCPRRGRPLFRPHPKWNTVEWPQRWPGVRRLGKLPAPLPVGG